MDIGPITASMFEEPDEEENAERQFKKGRWIRADVEADEIARQGNNKKADGEAEVFPSENEKEWGVEGKE